VRAAARAEAGLRLSVRPGPIRRVARVEEPNPARQGVGEGRASVRGRHAAVEGVRRCPNPTDEDCDIEIRPVAEAAEVGEAFASARQAQQERRRDARLRPAPPPSPHTP